MDKSKTYIFNNEQLYLQRKNNNLHIFESRYKICLNQSSSAFSVVSGSSVSSSGHQSNSFALVLTKTSFRTVSELNKFRNFECINPNVEKFLSEEALEAAIVKTLIANFCSTGQTKPSVSQYSSVDFLFWTTFESGKTFYFSLHWLKWYIQWAGDKFVLFLPLVKCRRFSVENWTKILRFHLSTFYPFLHQHTLDLISNQSHEHHHRWIEICFYEQLYVCSLIINFNNVNIVLW